MAKQKQTPLTAEFFHEEIIPAIEETLDRKIQEYRSEVLDFKAEVLGELKSLRDEVSTTFHQYERVDKRMYRVEKRLNLPQLDI